MPERIMSNFLPRPRGHYCSKNGTLGTERNVPMVQIGETNDGKKLYSQPSVRVDRAVIYRKVGDRPA